MSSTQALFLMKGCSDLFHIASIWFHCMSSAYTYKAGSRWVQTNNVFVWARPQCRKRQNEQQSRVIPWNEQREWILHSNVDMSNSKIWFAKWRLISRTHTMPVGLSICTRLASSPARNFHYNSEDNVSLIQPSSRGSFTWRFWQFHNDKNEVQINPLYFFISWHDFDFK